VSLAHPPGGRSAAWPPMLRPTASNAAVCRDARTYTALADPRAGTSTSAAPGLGYPIVASSASGCRLRTLMATRISTLRWASERCSSGIRRSGWSLPSRKTCTWRARRSPGAGGGGDRRATARLMGWSTCVHHNGHRGGDARHANWRARTGRRRIAVFEGSYHGTWDGTLIGGSGSDSHFSQA